MNQRLRFLLVAGAGTAADVGVVTATRSLGCPVFLAVAAGWTSSLCVGFLLNRRWVFALSADSDQVGSAVRYGALSAVNAVVAILGVGWAVTHSVPYLVCRLAASILLLILNFVACRTWVFRAPSGKRVEESAQEGSLTVAEPVEASDGAR